MQYVDAIVNGDVAITSQLVEYNVLVLRYPLSLEEELATFRENSDRVFFSQSVLKYAPLTLNDLILDEMPGNNSLTMFIGPTKLQKKLESENTIVIPAISRWVTDCSWS